MVSTIGGFIPALRGAAVERTHVCFYDRSEDGRFILDAWDKDARIIYGCGMSGRAFKFGPVIGERLARFRHIRRAAPQIWKGSGLANAASLILGLVLLD